VQLVERDVQYIYEEEVQSSASQFGEAPHHNWLCLSKQYQKGTNLHPVVSRDRVVGLLSGVCPIYFSPVEHSIGRNSEQVMQITTVLRAHSEIWW
jgi:hypothetical protein